MLLADIAVHHRLQLYTKVTTAENVSNYDHAGTDMMSLQLVYKDYQRIVLHDIRTVKTLRRQDKKHSERYRRASDLGLEAFYQGLVHEGYLNHSVVLKQIVLAMGFQQF